MAVENTILINTLIKEVFLFFILHIQRIRRCENTAVYGGSRDRACVHQRDRSDLSLLKLAAFAVREIACRMADRQIAVCRCVTGAETRAAERCLDHSARRDHIGQFSFFRQIHIDRRAGGINTHCKFIASDAASFEDIRDCAQILKTSAGASGDDALIDQKLTVSDLIGKRERCVRTEADFRRFLYAVQNIREVAVDLFDRKGIARMERHGDHRFDL